MKTLLLLFIAICSQSLGDVFLTKGMKTIGEVNTLDLRELFNIGVQVFSTPQIWLGILLLSIFFGLYLAALSWADLSFVLPVTASGYVMNAVMSWQLLGEQVSPVRWLGTLIICTGVVVVSRTEPRTTKDRRITGADAA
jgi:uncharacterized membrane protein